MTSNTALRRKSEKIVEKFWIRKLSRSDNRNKISTNLNKQHNKQIRSEKTAKEDK